VSRGTGVFPTNPDVRRNTAPVSHEPSRDWEPDSARALPSRRGMPSRIGIAVTRVTGGGPVEYGEAVRFEF
jgi:hypothetical protein